LNPDPGLQVFGKQMDALLAKYIKGAASFDECVDAVVTLLKSHFPTATTKRIPKELPAPSGSLLIGHVYAAAQEFTGADREKANAAVRAAYAKFFSFLGGAA